MHAHTYIYNAQEEAEMKFSCILNERKNWIAKKEEDVIYIDGGRVMAPWASRNPIWLWRKLSWQRNPEKTKKRKEGFGLLYNRQQTETLST